MANRENAQFASAEASLRQALQDLPDYAELSRNLIIEQTPEGLNIQLVDQEGRAMFTGSSAEPLARTQHLLEAVSKVIDRLPNRISISGHTDSASRPASPAIPTGTCRLTAPTPPAASLKNPASKATASIRCPARATREPLYPDDPDLPPTAGSASFCCAKPR